MDADGFEVVGRRHKRKAVKGARGQLAGTDAGGSCGTSETPATIVKGIESRLSAMEATEWLEECLDRIAEGLTERPVWVRTRGIGSVGRSSLAKYQCAFALALQRRFGSEERAPEFAEPLMVAEERAAVESLGFCVVTATESVEPPELLYMPHCPAGLYHDELKVRWTAAQLRGLCIVGNSFGNYFVRLAADRAPAVSKTEGFLTERALANAPFVEGAFNDTAVMTFAPPRELTPLTGAEQRHNDGETIVH